MRKTILFFALVVLTTIIYAQDTITGFSFPINDTISLYPNMGLTTNLGYVLRFENASTATYDTITFTNGATNFSATTTRWDNGDTVKSWTIKFKAPGYINFKISSKQRGGGNTPGPKNFQLQWRLNTGIYADVANGAIVCANDWTTGVVNQLSVPISGQGNDFIYIRWLMKGNLDVNGGIVAANGISKIDDILITATSTVGIEETFNNNTVSIYPNPSEGIITIHAAVPVQEINIYNVLGKLVFTQKSSQITDHIDLNAFGKGIYFVNVRHGDNNYYTGKVIVR